MEDFLRSYNILNEDEIAYLVELGKVKTIKKGDFYIKEGNISKDLSFVVSGIFRSFYYLDSGEEITYCFLFPGTLITAYSSFISQMPTNENYQALEDAELIVIPKNKIDELVQTSTNWLRLSKILAEEQYILLEQRVFMLQKEKAEKKYNDLISNNPEYIQKIPLNHLASYLGISQRHLSRIRKKNLI